jgi:hypothetical protein
MNANLWKIHDLEKVGDDLDLLAQFAVVSAFLKSADLEGSESVERDGRHGDIVLREMRDLELLLSENKIRKEEIRTRWRCCWMVCVGPGRDFIDAPLLRYFNQSTLQDE